jgi:hypothetical protein
MADPDLVDQVVAFFSDMFDPDKGPDNVARYASNPAGTRAEYGLGGCTGYELEETLPLVFDRLPPRISQAVYQGGGQSMGGATILAGGGGGLTADAVLAGTVNNFISNTQTQIDASVKSSIQTIAVGEGATATTDAVTASPGAVDVEGDVLGGIATGEGAVAGGAFGETTAATGDDAAAASGLGTAAGGEGTAAGGIAGTAGSGGAVVAGAGSAGVGQAATTGGEIDQSADTTLLAGGDIDQSADDIVVADDGSVVAQDDSAALGVTDTDDVDIA